MVEAPVDGVGRPAAPAEVRVEAREQTRVEVSVRGDADGLLVLGDPWYPQWRVEVDGRPAELLRVDHAFRGVRVPAGSGSAASSAASSWSAVRNASPTATP